VIIGGWNVGIARNDSSATLRGAGEQNDRSVCSRDINHDTDESDSSLEKARFIPVETAPDQPADAARPQTWAIWRTDDNGNTFLVRSGLPHPEALRLVAEFEARGHKQLYWAEAEMVAR
jgi:hypothetical protein